MDRATTITGNNVHVWVKRTFLGYPIDTTTITTLANFSTKRILRLVWCVVSGINNKRRGVASSPSRDQCF